MESKKLQPGSQFEDLDKNKDGVVYDNDLKKVTDPYEIRNIIKRYDLEGNGKISQEEMDVIERIIELETKKAKESDRDKREDAQRKMAWFALLGMLLYPVGIMVADFTGMGKASDLLSEIAPTYFVAIAGLVAAFFGAQAYVSKND